MTAPDVAARVAAMEAAPDAPESLRERVARAMWEADFPDGGDCPPEWVEIYLGRADAAITVLTTPANGGAS